MNPVNVAIVGCGRISDLHQMGYRDRTDARIVAVCDTNKSRARKKAKEWGVEKVYTDYQQLLEDKTIDLFKEAEEPITSAFYLFPLILSLSPTPASTLLGRNRLLASRQGAGR